MMIRLLALCLCGLVALCLTGAAATAGAWPRDKGTGFASLSIWEGAADTEGYTAFFAEYGLFSRLTLGFDAGRSVSGQNKAVAFLRVPLGRALGGLIAGELGYGDIAGRRVLRPGLSWGRSISRPRWQGWLGIDTLLEIDVKSLKLDEKTDITLGVTLLEPDGRPADWTMMLQLQTGVVDLQQQLLLLQTQGIQPGASFVRIVPSVTYRLNDGLHLELGYFHALDGSRARGIKLGLWSRF